MCLSTLVVFTYPAETGLHDFFCHMTISSLAGMLLRSIHSCLESFPAAGHMKLVYNIRHCNVILFPLFDLLQRYTSLSHSVILKHSSKWVNKSKSLSSIRHACMIRQGMSPPRLRWWKRQSLVQEKSSLICTTATARSLA